MHQFEILPISASEIARIELTCSRIHGFVYQIENDKYSIYDPWYYLIVYTLRSIWHYPFFINDIQIFVNIRNMQNQQIVFFCIENPICIFVRYDCSFCLHGMTLRVRTSWTFYIGRAGPYRAVWLILAYVPLLSSGSPAVSPHTSMES